MPEEKSWKYRVKYERAAGVGRTDGFSVEANGDDFDAVEINALTLYKAAIHEVENHYPVLEKKP